MKVLGGRSVSKIVAVSATVFAVFSVLGLITSMMLSAFVFDRYDAYGRIPIPGSSTVYLPAGTVTVNFAVRANGDGTAVPPLNMDIVPPPGVADPEVTEDLGGSVTLNDTVHRRVWVMQVPAEGGYRVQIDGPVTGYRDPHLTFGEDDSAMGVVWVFVALSVISCDLAVAAWWLRRKNGPPAAKPVPPAEPTGPFEPTDQGVRLEQLKTITALRDSGALTEDEFDAEKRRILDGH